MEAEKRRPYHMQTGLGQQLKCPTLSIDVSILNADICEVWNIPEEDLYIVGRQQCSWCDGKIQPNLHKCIEDVCALAFRPHRQFISAAHTLAERAYTTWKEQIRSILMYPVSHVFYLQMFMLINLSFTFQNRIFQVNVAVIHRNLSFLIMLLGMSRSLTEDCWEGESARVFALLIGINAYKSGGIWNLESCVDDANRMRRWLRHDLHVARENICMLTDSKATKANIEEKFTSHLINNPRIQRGDAIIM